MKMNKNGQATMTEMAKVAEDSKEWQPTNPSEEKG